MSINRRPAIDAISTSALTFDDIKVGDRFVIGAYEMTREAIIDFASKYDPQPWHLSDEGAAANPVFGRLSASGWHTTVVISMLVDRFWKSTRVRGMAGGGVDGLRWMAPVFAGDVLTGEVTIIVARTSASKPDRGIITQHILMRNQDGHPVAEATIAGIMARG